MYTESRLSTTGIMKNDEKKKKLLKDLLEEYNAPMVDRTSKVFSTESEPEKPKKLPLKNNQVRPD